MDDILPDNVPGCFLAINKQRLRLLVWANRCSQPGGCARLSRFMGIIPNKIRCLGEVA